MAAGKNFLSLNCNHKEISIIELLIIHGYVIGYYILNLLWCNQHRALLFFQANSLKNKTSLAT
jgi:hypothetical protein